MNGFQHNAAVWSLRRQRLQEQYNPPGDLWTWLKQSNTEYGCGPAALAAIDCLSRGSAAVVTGQQAGLLTGPLYTVYKAASAVILARKLTMLLGETVVPVFWLASEDHDFQEVRWAWFPAGEKLAQITFPGEYTLTPAAEIPLTAADVERVISQVQEILPVTEFTPDVLSLIANSAGNSFADWCGSLLSRLFKDAGLIVLDSCGLPVRMAARPIFAAAVERGPEIHSLLAEKTGEMLASGRKPGLDVPEDHSHIFLMQDSRRLGLLRHGSSFSDRADTVTLSKSELLAMADQEPWKLSPNVVLRPLVQECVLPVLAIIAGPGEEAYLEQLQPVFRMFGLEQPPVLPRLGGVLLEPAIRRLLQKYSLASSVQDYDSWLQAEMAKADALGIPAAFAALRGKITEGYEELVPGLAGLDPQLGDLSRKNLDKVLEQVEWLEKRATASHRQKHKELQEHAARLQTALFPRGGQQQRMHNCFWYINKYGPGFIEILLQLDLVPDLELQL